MCINKKLTELRKELNLSKKKLSEILDMKYTTYVNYEGGLREPSFEFLIKIAKFYNVSIDYIFGVTDVKLPFYDKSLNIVEEDLDFIKKYKQLDDYSKIVVNNIIDLELKRNE
nr:helix-turn-helix transcriptional regulator [uncultured Tyzzerella sp.]